jgi:hypothetical protein
MTDPKVTVLVNQMIRERGAEYERLVERRIEHERIRKQEARKRQTPEQREHDRVRKQEVRERQTPEQREKEREERRSRRKLPNFMAVDGEGGGTDALGRQNYFLMCASGQTAGEEYICHRNGQPLSIRDRLEFILSLPGPTEKILVMFGLGYDATQILRGIATSTRGQQTLRRILNPPQGKNGPATLTGAITR